MFNQRRWRTREELASAIVDWSKRDYNTRRQRVLGKLASVQLELALANTMRQAEGAA